MASNPAYVNSPIIIGVQLTTANPALDGTGTLALGFQGVSGSGGVTENIKIRSVGKTNEGKIRVFIYTGGIAYFIKEIKVPENQDGFEADIPFNQVLPSGSSIKYTSDVANTFNIVTSGGDF